MLAKSHHLIIPVLHPPPNFEYNLFRQLYILPTHGERDSGNRGAEGASQGRSHASLGDTLRQTDRRDAATLERTPSFIGRGGHRRGKSAAHLHCGSISQVKDRVDGHSLRMPVFCCLVEPRSKNCRQKESRNGQCNSGNQADNQF
jgi:hypothetical protein